jgi:hypothetical protein
VQTAYPKVSENGGRPPIPLERMLRIFGMNVHIGVDSETKLIHTILVSAANVADREALPFLLHGTEARVWGDQGYHGQAPHPPMRTASEGLHEQALSL